MKPRLADSAPDSLALSEAISPVGGTPMLSFDLGNATLIASSFLLSCMVGTGVYQHLFVMPSWFEESPVSFKKINQYGKAEVRFWGPLQGLTLASMLLAFLECRHDPARRTLI